MMNVVSLSHAVFDDTHNMSWDVGTISTEGKDTVCVYKTIGFYIIFYSENLQCDVI